MRHTPNLWHTLELLYLLVLKELKVRYKSSVLGYIWALANPFLFAVVYWVAFKFVMRVQIENYSLFLLTGMFPWLWMHNGITHATKIYQANSSLIKRVRVNRAVFPLSAIAQELTHFLLALPVVVAFVALVGGKPLHMSWLWQIPLLSAVQFLFIYPLALVFAIANVFAHDVEHLVGIAFSALFFATPIVYPLDMVPEGFRVYFESNPFHALIDNWRSVLLHGVLSPNYLLYSIACGLCLGALSLAVYRRYAGRLGELL